MQICIEPPEENEIYLTINLLFQPFAPNDAVHFYFKRRWSRDKFVASLTAVEVHRRSLINCVEYRFRPGLYSCLKLNEYQTCRKGKLWKKRMKKKSV